MNRVDLARFPNRQELTSLDASIKVEGCLWRSGYTSLLLVLRRSNCSPIQINVP
jgi:hypothetical protein